MKSRSDIGLRPDPMQRVMAAMDKDKPHSAHAIVAPVALMDEGIYVDKDGVTVHGVLIRRPRGRSPSEWMGFWQRVSEMEEALNSR